MCTYFHLKNSNGLSLVEVLVAMVLTSMIAVALITTASQSVFFNESADDVYTASLVAQQRIEVLKKFDFYDIGVVGPETNTAVDVNSDSRTDFYRTTEITEDFDGYTDLLKVKVSVSRVDMYGNTAGSPIVLESMILERE